MEPNGGFMTAATYPGYHTNYYSSEDQLHQDKQLEFTSNSNSNFRGSRGTPRSSATSVNPLNFRSDHPQSPSNRSTSDQ